MVRLHLGLPMTLRALVFISLFLFAAHGFEEYLGRFHTMDPLTLAIASLLHTSPTALFVGVQFLLGLLFLLLLSAKRSWRRPLLYVLGIAFLFELSHPLQAIRDQQLRAGLMTSLILLSWGVYVWSHIIFRSHQQTTPKR